ncbi:MAG: signal transduction histidine kinase/ActR/RegA family two-component response regulator [Polaribacter sp.]|jgi:signal transduction histidine kinase/ActR/RegA family two-component response regulator
MQKFSQRRINLVFRLTIVNIGFAILCTIISDKFDFIWLRNYNAINIFAYVIAAFLAKKERLTSARIIYLLTSNIGIAIIASYVGRGGSIEFIYMFNIGVPFILFSYRRERALLMIFSILPLVLWILLFLTDFNLFASKKLDVNIAKEFIYPISIISMVSLVLFQLIYFILLNSRYFGEIRKKEDEALEASDAKSKFLSTMSHEIRTPLNAVIGLSYILSDDNPRKDQIENINALNYSGKLLLNLLNNVLDFSKMKSTKIELDNIPANLSEAIKQIKKIHEASCFKKGISFNIEIDDAIPLIWLDVVRFNQVLNNLVTNSIKFTDKGSITLKISPQNQTKKTIDLLIEVIDTGIGIPEDKQDSIWEAFVQASSTTNRLYGGTGLGLPIVKSIVKIMGDDVKIDSQVGKGSRFYFNLKLDIASEKELEKTIEKRTHNFEGKTILLVEDNLINIMVGKQILEKAQLQVEVAHDGLTAVNMVKKDNYDAILMDIQMPIMDGYTAAREIRKFNTKIPILALSASIFMEVKDKIHESGMNGFIFKPFDPEDLLNHIEDAINNSL